MLGCTLTPFASSCRRSAESSLTAAPASGADPGSWSPKLTSHQAAERPAERHLAGVLDSPPTASEARR